MEIKARVADAAALKRRVAALADGGPESLVQTDTFFRVPAGRLKLRERSGGSAELIFYRRPDTADPALSQFHRVAVREGGGRALRELLRRALGTAGTVSKRRLVYQLGRTRVHLDAVRDLGRFVELEVVLAPREPVAAGIRDARRLMGELRIPRETLVAEAYVDLLAKRRREGGRSKRQARVPRARAGREGR